MNLKTPGGKIKSSDQTITFHVASMAGRGDRHVELAVGREADELPAVVHVGRQLVEDELRLMNGGKVFLHIVDAMDLPDLRDVERAVAEGDAIGHGQPVGDLEHLAVGQDGVDRAAGAGAYE